MPQIPLTLGRAALVDDQDYDYLMQWQWRYSSNGYGVRTENHNGQREYIWLHRAIMNPLPHEIVDHISGNRLDNRRSNLRLVNKNQNQWNRRKNRNGSCVYKGVCWHRKGWYARIRYQGKRIHLAYCEDSEQAARLYDAAAYHFFGAEYAVVNFPGEPVSGTIQDWLRHILTARGMT